MTSSEIRQSFLDFFREKQHTIVPSSSLLPDAPNLLFTNAGMNQFVPIFLGQAPCPYKPARAADTQKCIRAGGKHNDLEDVGFDTYHHTMFEMLGNWSFGDYFKKEAIEWAWELVVKRWGFPPSRVYATIYSPGEGDPASLDREAHEHWSEIFIQNKLDPAYHVVHGNKKDNFWMMGETGPCGPCSELHIDLTPGPRDLDIPRQIAGRNLVNKGDARCIEIWNLVFIQFNANPDGTFVDLPSKHVDTGMGFERVTSMIQGTKGFTDFSQSDKISNYETDVFRPLFDELEKITGKTYRSTLPASAQNLTEQEKIDVAFRVIADHIRTLSFSIADGIQPSNEGRGYVLRRILRRAVRYGRNLGLHEAFLGKLVDVLGKTMGHVFPEVVAKATAIKKTLTQEEESFLRTLDSGIVVFSRAVALLENGLAKQEEALVYADELNKLWATKIGGRVQSFIDDSHDLIARLMVCTRDFSALEFVRLFGREGHAVQAVLTRLNMAEEHTAMGDVLQGGEQYKSQHISQNLGKLIPALKNIRLELNRLPGRAAFVLYDTYGFPLDLTQLMAREGNMTIDENEFKRLMDEQKARGKAAQKKEIITLSKLTEITDDSFKYEDVHNAFGELKTTVAGAGEPFSDTGIDLITVIPAETQFYAGMGGQVSDTGTITIGGITKEIVAVERVGPAVVHRLNELLRVEDMSFEPAAVLKIDGPRRARIEGHHSGTHIMHWALRKVLGTTVSQKGSYVGPDRLRFDFSHGTAMTPEEVAQVEQLVNEKIEADLPVSWAERPYAEVKGDPSILQFFGDKYGESVRVVSIGDFSKELCGGTHVRQSKQVGYFKILHESAIAAGVRRIEAVSGAALTAHIAEHLPKQVEAHAALAQRKPDLAALPAVQGEDVPQLYWKFFQDRETFLKKAAADVAQHEKENAKQMEAAFQRQAATDADELIEAVGKINGVPFLHEVVDEPAAYLPILADAFKQKKWQGVALLVAVEESKVALLAAVSPEFTKKIQAGKIIQAVAPLVGGKGGGRPELAQGGGNNPAGVPAALEKFEELLRAAV